MWRNHKISPTIRKIGKKLLKSSSWSMFEVLLYYNGQFQKTRFWSKDVYFFDRLENIIRSYSNYMLPYGEMFRLVQVEKSYSEIRGFNPAMLQQIRKPLHPIKQQIRKS